jgi:hypothetical protein
VRGVLDASQTRGRIDRGDATNRAWEAIYPKLTEDRPGMLGAATARAEAHVLRLSLLYALLDDKPAIEVPHLEAALALWQFAAASAGRLFGDAVGDPVADRVLAALRRNGPMSQNDLRDLFGQHVKSAVMGRALETLVAAGLVTSAKIETEGRPRTMWQARS